MLKAVVGVALSLLLAACHELSPAKGHHADDVPSSEGADDRARVCQIRTAPAWRAWLEDAASDDRWVETCEDSPCDDEFYAFVKTDVQSVLDGCAPFLQQNPPLAKCTENLRRFVPMWMRQHDEVSYGFDVDNRTYLSRETAPGKPAEMMQVPDALVEALPDVAKVEAAARRNGWKYLTHNSALSGARTFVVIPDAAGRFDKWMILNADVTTDPVDPLKQTLASTYKTDSPLSMLVVEKLGPDGQKLPKVRLDFRDWSIEPKAGGPGFALALDEERNGKCFACHPSGVRQLIPRHTPILQAKPVQGEDGYAAADDAPAPAEFAFKRLLEFNDRLRSYGLPEWGDLIDPQNLGPRVGEKDGCTDCHNGSSRGRLSVFTSMGQLHEKMVTQLSMPPSAELTGLLERQVTQKPPLSSDEQARLAQAVGDHRQLSDGLIGSRSAELKAWLLQSACQ